MIQIKVNEFSLPKFHISIWENEILLKIKNHYMPQPMEAKNLNAGTRLECPIYYTLKKCHLNHDCLITSIWLPIRDGIRHEHWIKRGVVLGCHTADES